MNKTVKTILIVAVIAAIVYFVWKKFDFTAKVKTVVATIKGNPAAVKNATEVARSQGITTDEAITRMAKKQVKLSEQLNKGVAVA